MIKLYHGSNLIIDRPMLIVQNRFLDFGFGFYTTTNYEQARSFALKVASRRRSGKATVSKYEFDSSLLKTNELDILRFDEAGEDWLNFVSANRAGKHDVRQHDIIIGAVANDDVYTTFNLYQSGLLNKEQALQALKIKKLYDQIVFATEKAIGQLKFIGSEEIKL